MLKSLLEQVKENANCTAHCPACTQSPGMADRPRNQMGPGNNGFHKRGRYEGLKRSAMPVCPFCQGRGVVYLNRICECGMPAILFSTKDKIWTCGSLDCLGQALWRMARALKPSVSTANGRPLTPDEIEWYGRNLGGG